MRAQSHPRGRRLAALAARQHGVVALWQLVALGLGRGAIRHAVAAGRLHRIHAGVYAVGHARLTQNGRWMAAVLAGGAGAVLSHGSAAALWGLVRARRARTDVTVVARGRAQRRGIALHQVRSLHADDRTIRDSIPITSLSRTLLDFAEVAPPRQLEKAYDQAERLRLLDVRVLARVCARSPGRRGLKPLGALLRGSREVADTRSDLEDDFAAFCRSHRLPMPAFNALVEGFLVDAVWPGRRLVVELDSWSFHRTRDAFERDRARDEALQLARHRVIRVTSRRMAHEPAALEVTLRALLDR
jgi:very-short-patch-repair endonuclease